VTWLIGLALKAGIPAKWAKGAVIAILIALLLAGLGIGKCAYDKRVIANHEAKQEAATAKADRKADAKAAEQRRADDNRSTAEATEIKEAVNEAGNDPAARRAAYYRCVQLQQSARKSGKPSPDC
jgi:predicted lipid-binding transport protein (Tim44 family)